jgi:hypothetical protein
LLPHGQNQIPFNAPVDASIVLKEITAMEINKNSQVTSLETIKNDLIWLSTLIEARITNHFSGVDDIDIFDSVPPPDLSEDNSMYAQTLKKFQFNTSERIILLMALATHVNPILYDIFFLKNEHSNRTYTEFGGVTGNAHSGFIPTGETVSFILCGRDFEKRFHMLDYFSDAHTFYRSNMVSLSEIKNGEPVFSGMLTISKEYLSLLTQGKQYEPQFSSAFPAKKITTDYCWEDAVYDELTIVDLDTIRGWIRHQSEILNNQYLNKYLKRGYRVLFHGPPGTGKTMTAALLGKEAQMDVYQVDLSAIVSKYIGETEKNLSAVFDMAENKNWILFFDEADALFGKRSQTQSSNDQFANQQVSYLLQRIEDYNGIVLLSTNFKDNIDAAFLRRFQSLVYFPKPKTEQRLKLWDLYFSKIFDADIDFDKIAAEYEISGGSMINVLRYCSILSMQRGSNKIYEADIYNGIRREYQKEGIFI